MKHTRGIAVVALSFFLLNDVSLWAYFEPRRIGERSAFGEGRDANTFQDSFLQKTRLLQQKQQLSVLQEEIESNALRQGGAQAAVNSEPSPPDVPDANEEISDSDIQPIEASSLDPSATAVYNWTKQVQSASTLGLVASYPNDSALKNQAFTYDQALSGTVFLKQGDAASAKKIFEFYNSRWDGTGFWTVYNSQYANGTKVEYDKVMGPNAWIALFALQYHSATGDSRALDLATKVAKWIKGLPRRDGGVAMGAAGTFWAGLFSVENNLDYYAVAKILSTRAASRADQQLFANETNTVKNWIKNKGYDSATGLFRRGAYGDNVKSLDTNSWAVLTFGIDTLKKDFGIDPNALVQKMEKTFGVQGDGSFGGDALKAKGFDFSDSVNASGAGRLGIKWVEGTNHVVDVYKQLASYYSQTKTLDRTKASYYTTRAGYFASRNADNAVSGTNTLSYLYTDHAGAQIFSDNPYWKSASGSSVASSAWVYFSTYNFNPFSQLVSPGGSTGVSGSFSPNYSDFWGIQKIGLGPSVWNLYKGEGIKIGIVDTGVSYDENNIAANIWENPAELNGLPGVDDDGDGYVDDVNGWDFADNDNDPLDLNGHGTHVAGIAAGNIGVAPLAKIIPVRVLDRSGSGTLEAVARGIEYAARVGANIINLSLGAAGLNFPSLLLLQKAVNFARNLGSIVVAAAGNSSSNVNRFSPANLDGVIAVGATDSNDRRAWFSNFGSKLFMTAPGVDILSLGTPEAYIGTQVGDDLYRASGTSMAAPFVSGAVALLLDKYPGASFNFIRSKLAAGAKDLGTRGWDPYYGYGRLDVAASLGIKSSVNAFSTPMISARLSPMIFSRMVLGGPVSGISFFSDVRFTRTRAEEELALLGIHPAYSLN